MTEVAAVLRFLADVLTAILPVIAYAIGWWDGHDAGKRPPETDTPSTIPAPDGGTT